MLSEVNKVVILSVAFKALVGSGAATLPKSEAKVTVSASGKTAKVEWPAILPCGKKVVLKDVVTLAA
jgi:hypothetical protein